MPAYLDHNATTPVRPDVISTVAEVMRTVGNPSSVHDHGQAARRIVDRARRQVGKALCARPEDVIFTGCGSEALNLALHSAIQAGAVERILISAIEHEAVAATAQASGLAVTEIPVDANGVLDHEALQGALSSGPRALVAVMLANNEMGTIQPVADIAAMARAQDALLLVDAIQGVGKIPVDFAAIGADYLALSAHKFGGPQGVAALLARCDAPLARQLHGGGQELGRRAGTLNVAGIAGLGLALEQAVAGLEGFADLAGWRDEIADSVSRVCPDVVILGQDAARLPNTLSMAVPDWRGETQVLALDLAGVSISAGSACSSGKSRGSKLGTALKLEDRWADGVVRISLGWNTTREDVDAVIAAWTDAYQRARATSKVNA